MQRIMQVAAWAACAARGGHRTGKLTVGGRGHCCRNTTVKFEGARRWRTSTGGLGQFQAGPTIPMGRHYLKWAGNC
jgi:hypothetical protein